jgi:hypothetical protein
MICVPRASRDSRGWCADTVVQFVRNCVFCNTTGVRRSDGQALKEGTTDLFFIMAAGGKRRKGPTYQLRIGCVYDIFVVFGIYEDGAPKEWCKGGGDV